MQRFAARNEFARNCVLASLFCVVLITTPARAVDLFSEDFEGLTLGPVVTFASEIREREAWTKTPPAGWTQDDSGVPTVGNPNIGVKEFEGWTFVNKDWWAATADDQDRTLFTNASGIIAVADPDEWDDFPSFPPTPDDLGTFDAKLRTPSIIARRRRGKPSQSVLSFLVACRRQSEGESYRSLQQRNRRFGLHLGLPRESQRWDGGHDTQSQISRPTVRTRA